MQLLQLSVLSFHALYYYEEADRIADDLQGAAVLEDEDRLVPMKSQLCNVGDQRLENDSLREILEEAEEAV